MTKGQNLTGAGIAAMKRYSSAGAAVKATGELTNGLLENATHRLRGAFEPRLGGFSRAPKFPPHGTLRLLLAEHRRTGDAGLLRMATVTLDSMAPAGGLRPVGASFLPGWRPRPRRAERRRSKATGGSGR